MWKKALGSGTVGPITYLAFATTYCPTVDVFAYGHKESQGAAWQGLQIRVNGTIVGISKGQSEGHYGYQNVGVPVAAGECFRIEDIGGGGNRLAWYRPI